MCSSQWMIDSISLFSRSRSPVIARNVIFILHNVAVAYELSLIDSHYNSAPSTCCGCLALHSVSSYQQLPWERHKARGAVCGKLSGPFQKGEKKLFRNEMVLYLCDGCLSPSVRRSHLQFKRPVFFSSAAFSVPFVLKLPQETLEVSCVEETDMTFTQAWVMIS